jgi:hypothetical protein
LDDASAQLRPAIDMCETGVSMHRLTLRRRHADLTAEQIEELLQAWLFDRPSALEGDAVGRARRRPGLTSA